MKELTRDEAIVLLDCFVSAYSHVLTRGYYRAHTGKEFAEEIRRCYSQENARNRLAAEIAERFVKSVSVRADGYTKWEVAES